MTVIHGDSIQVLKTLEPESVDFCFTSPTPFGYGGGQGIGSEMYWNDYINNLIKLFKEVYSILKPTGCLWMNMSDRHDNRGSMWGVPERFVLQMLDEGWLYRSPCYWIRTEKFDYQEDYQRFARDVEHLYFFTKTNDHYFNNPSKKVQSSVFYAAYKPPKQDFASGFPEKIIERCISLTCPPKGTVLDPLCDSAVTGVVAKRMGRPYIMIDISYEKVLAAKARLGEK